MKTVAIRLKYGQDLLAEIQKVARTWDIEAGVVLSAVGTLSSSNIRLPITTGGIEYIHPEDAEIDSLHGTVSKNGCHLHITVSDMEGKAWGGHLKEGNIVRTSCELVIGILDDVSFTREWDDETGFDELKVAPKR